MSRSALVAVVAVSSVLAACGNGSNKGTPAGGDAGPGVEAGVDAAVEGGAEGGEEEATAYPAFAVDLPQVKKNQGAVLTAPVVVTVSWPGDTDASTWEGFGDAIGSSSYWSATTSEYGVGAATSGTANHVRMAQPLPSSLSYTDLQTFVAAAVQATGSDAGAGEAGAGDAGSPNPTWPVPSVAGGEAQTIYALYVPSTTAVTDPGTGASFCVEGANGYHDSVAFGSGQVAYAVTLECPGQSAALTEEAAAHELVESATDPYIESTSLGYVGFDTDHAAWDLYTGFADEVCDACQNWQDSYYEETGSFPYWVQRSWSNAAAAKGAAPCVPAAAGPYYGITMLPSQESSVSVDLTSLGLGKETTKGFPVTVGQALTFQVGFFSDAAAPAWTIAYDFPSETQLFTTSGGTVSNGSATVSLDKTTGQNGDVANVTVTVKTKGSAGFHVMAITWDPPSSKTFAPKYYPVLLVDQ